MSSTGLTPFVISLFVACMLTKEQGWSSIQNGVRRSRNSSSQSPETKWKQASGKIARLLGCDSGLVEQVAKSWRPYICRPADRKSRLQVWYTSCKRRDDRRAPRIPRRPCLHVHGPVLSLDAHSDSKSQRTQRHYRAIRA